MARSVILQKPMPGVKEILVSLRNFRERLALLVFILATMIYLHAESIWLLAAVSESLLKNGTDVAMNSRERSRISYTLHRGIPHKDTFGHRHYKCSPQLGKRSPLHPAMKNVSGLLDYSTQVTTDLNVIFMGDSISMQYGQAFEEAAGASRQHRSVLRYSWGRHEGLHVAAPVRGGGVVAGWRITGIMSRDRENMELPNAKGGGWKRSDAHNLTGHTYDTQDDANATRTVGSFDAMVLRIPHGWIPLEAITVPALHEAVAMAHELFGVSTMVVVTLPFANNVVTMKDLTLLQEKNDLLRDFVNGWNKTDAIGVDNLLLLEFGNFADLLMEWNGRLMGMDTSNANYTMENLGSANRHFSQSIAQTCSQRVPVGAKKFERNHFSVDGQHWCMNTMAGRFNAGTACLLGCAYNDETSSKSPLILRECEKRCNDQFMSLEPVPSSTLI